MSIDLSIKVQEWKQKISAGTMTQDDMREAVRFLRADRTSAHVTSGAAKARKSAAKATPDGESLLRELDGL